MFRIKHILIRIALSVSLLIVIAVLVTTTLVSYVYTKELVKNSVEITEQKMDLIINELEDQVEKVIELENTIQEDQSIQELILARSNGALNEADISEQLRKYAYANISVSSIFMFDVNKDVLDPLYKIEPYEDIIKNYQPFDDFINDKKYSGLSGPSDFPNPSYNKSSSGNNTITYFANFIDQNTFVQLGYLLINIKKDYMFNDFNRSCEKEFDFVIVIDEKGQIIETIGNMTDDNELLESIINTEVNNNSVTVKNVNTYIINRTVENYTNWTVVAGVSYKTLTASGTVMRDLVLIIISVSVLLVILMSFLISKRITKPIIEVANSMKKLEKENWPNSIEVKSKDELKILVDGYNKMLVNVKTLIAQVKEEQYITHEFEINNLRLRLELLQSQINPHFVHNTLNGVKYLAIENKTKEIVEMIESLNMLLRSSMAIDTDFITIEKEIDCTKSFLTIFNVRYDFEVALNLNIEDDLQDISVPKLILQPIVENSAYHGIISRGCDGKIFINISKIKNEMGLEEVLIEVADNGIGMTETEVENIFKKNNTSNLIVNKKGFNNIGLKNINDRLNLYYGDTSFIKIESEINIGTKVSFKIPLHRLEANFE